MMKPQHFSWHVAAFILSTIAPVAAAPAAQSDAGDGETAIQITPYVWASSFGGTIRPGSGQRNFRVKKGFGELLEDVDAAFFISGLVKHGRLIAVADFTHTGSSRDGRIPTGNPALPTAPARGTLRQTSTTALVGYRVVDQDDVSLDLLAGGRAWWIRPKVAVPILSLSAKANANFVDPIVATRLNVKTSSRSSLLFYGDMGGFGVGSEMTGQAVATANLRITRSIWLSGGYRYLLVDYKARKARADVSLGGPIFGATLAF
jgi:hypothetical protein